jgi:hypothetical protein
MPPATESGGTSDQRQFFSGRDRPAPLAAITRHAAQHEDFRFQQQVVKIRPLGRVGRGPCQRSLKGVWMFLHCGFQRPIVITSNARVQRRAGRSEARPLERVVVSPRFFFTATKLSRGM